MYSRKIKLKNLEMEVLYEFHKGEKPIRYDSDLAGHPGTDDSVEVMSVVVPYERKEIDIYFIIDQLDLLPEVERILLETHEEE